MRALISVANREGLTYLAEELLSHDVTVFATSDTQKVLQEEHVGVVESVEKLTHFAEILNGRVKTLHPAIFGGILARHGFPQDEKDLQTHHISPIDIVVVNFLPFTAVVAQSETTLTDALEQIDVGGVALVRAAARNFQDVLVLVRPEDYTPVMQEWREQGEVSSETRRRLAAIAFQHTASYDTAVAEYLRVTTGEHFPAELTLALNRVQFLRYGENPHQLAAFYSWEEGRATAKLPNIADAEMLYGRDLSYNNLLDIDVALSATQSFTAPTVAIIKHTNPCGLACDDNLLEAYRKAHAGDPLSSSGGVIGCNRSIDEATAQEVTQLFYEAIIAPEFTPAAFELLRQQKYIRLLATHRTLDPKAINAQLLSARHPEVRSVAGGLLLQTPDFVGDGDAEYRVVTEREPTLEEVTDLMFAWKVVRCVKSNAIVLAHKLMVMGVGAGQMNRVASVHLAVEKAAERARGSVLASDAFFPFSDGIECAAKAGVTAIIQPGGSVRDEEAIRSANHYALAMIFTGKRHFRH